jgi:UDP-GlcNAc3NAcA epimerase
MSHIDAILFREIHGMMRLVTIVGARPQFIKAAAFSKALSNFPEIKELSIHTGQHYDINMSDIFYDEMGIPPVFQNLNISEGNHGEMTGRQLIEIEQTLIDTKPDWVVVFGDTNSTLAGALAAAKLNIPVAHVEAGMRSYNRKMPEEINRVLTDHVSELLFTPMKSADDILIKEGISQDKIYCVGDIMYDSLRIFGTVAQKNSTILEDIGLTGTSYRLVTCHRPSNTENSDILKTIVSVLNKLSESQKVVFPLHPRTRKRLNDYGLIDNFSSEVILLDPVGYLDMIKLVQNSSMLISDSGGLQKDGLYYKKPMWILREEIEWKELAKSGWARITENWHTNTIFEGILQLENCTLPDPSGLIGDGRSADRMVQIIQDQ